MNVIRRKSPNYGYPQGKHGRNGAHVRAVVLHIAQGSVAGCDAWFATQGSEASTHFLIGKDGVVYQYVNLWDAAWGNGVAAQPTWPLLIPDVNPNLYTISIEHEGMTGEPWTPEMYKSDVELLRILGDFFAFPLDRQHIIGHCEIDSVNRPNCPGAGLDWNRLMEGLR